MKDTRYLFRHTSVHGAINMLGVAKRLRATILQASTSEVYDDPSVHPQIEDYWGNVNPVGLRSCYDEGKRCAETLFFDYWRQHRLRIKVPDVAMDEQHASAAYSHLVGSVLPAKSGPEQADVAYLAKVGGVSSKRCN